MVTVLNESGYVNYVKNCCCNECWLAGINDDDDVSNDEIRKWNENVDDGEKQHANNE